MATDLSDRGEAEVEDLVHHGVKGQKWGVIRKKASAGRKATIKAIQKSGRFTANATKTTIKTARTGAAKVQKAKQAHDQRVAGKKQAKADAKARKKFANRGYKKISDSELQSRIKRLEQEKRYRELKADRHLVRGREVTRSILENSLTKAGTYAGTKLMKSAFDNAFEGATGGKAGKKSAAETLKKAAEKAKEAAEAASVVAEEAKSEARSVGGPALKKAKTPKQIEKPKSYKQTKPSPKKKRYPRNPGSTAK
jgi:hypothetical protein|nr:MAG TPA: hypothetical protein [Caudoviricetes sp.]